MKRIKTIFSPINRLIKNIYQGIIRHLGISFLLRLSRHKKVVVNIYDSNGDTLYTCAYFKELVKESKEKCLFLVSENRKFFVERFNFENVYYYNKHQEKLLKSLIYSNSFKKKLSNRKKKNILVSFPWFYYDKRQHQKYPCDFLTLIKKDIFKLNNDNPTIEYIKVEDKKLPIDISKKFVIFNCHSNSANLPLFIFEEIAKKLKNQGYICYTNSAINQKEIPGTINFVCSLDELAIASKYASAVISIRTGALDYIVSYAKRIFAIYDNDSDLQIYNLNQWKTSNEIHEYLYDFKDDSNIVDTVVNDFLSSDKTSKEDNKTI